jgi:hypothetical protein
MLAGPIQGDIGMAAWYDRHFKSDFDQNRKALKDSTAFEASWRQTVVELHDMMTVDGYDPSSDAALVRTRRKATEGSAATVGSRTTTTAVAEDVGLLAAVGVTADPIPAVPKARAAALKAARHTYLLNRSGNSQVWVHALPTDFTDWASYALADAATPAAVRTLLKSSGEHFNALDRKRLATSVQQAMAWCQKAGMVLADAVAPAGAAGPSPQRTAAREVVKRWFVGRDAVTEGDTDVLARNLINGFKSLVAAVGRGNFLLTDFVPLRAATTADQKRFFDSEAFTMRSRYEGMDVVYIESNFFTRDAGGVIFDQDNWTRIVVHELSHLIAGTVDHDDRYAHSGIGVHAGFPSSKAIVNADSWAFFAADCAGVLTAGHRLQALAER